MTSAETGQPGRDIDQGIAFGHRPSRSGTDTRHSDPLVLALARYVEALHRRYPEGPEQMRREGLDGRATITGMRKSTRGRAA